MEIEGFNTHGGQQWCTIKWQVYPWNPQYLRVCEIPLSCLLIGIVSQSVDLGQSNNPNTTPTKDYENV